MSHPFTWTIFCFVIYLVIKNDNISCQCINPNEGCAASSAELISTLVKELSPAGRTQLVNALLSAASNNGILPELSSVFQPSQPTDCFTATANSVPQTVNVLPIVANIPTTCRSDPIPSSAPIINPSIDSLYCLGLTSPPKLEPLPQNDFPPYISSPQSVSDIVNSIYTPAYIEPYFQIPPQSPSTSYSLFPSSSPSMSSSCSSSSSSSTSSSPLSTSSASSSSTSSSSSSSSTQSPKTISSPSHLDSSITLPPSPSTPSSCSSSIPSSPPLPTISTITISPQFDCGETTPNIGSQPNPYSSYYTSDSEYPVNLEINIPALSVPEPRITIITTDRPAPYPVTKKSSPLKKMLPLLLMAMLCNERNNNACCNCNSPNIVPIPYPFPIYSPGFCSFCGNYVDDDEEDDDIPKKGNRRRREDPEAWEKRAE